MEIIEGNGEECEKLMGNKEEFGLFEKDRRIFFLLGIGKKKKQLETSSIVLIGRF